MAPQCLRPSPPLPPPEVASDLRATAPGLLPAALRGAPSGALLAAYMAARAREGEQLVEIPSPQVAAAPVAA